jgi:enamine deaminase RidA (YjgF/YER057c/UK114 family)
MRRVALGIDPEYPYSKVIKADGFIYIKSHVGIDPANDEIPEGIVDQTRLTLDWLRHALEDAGGQMSGLVKINVYLADIDGDFNGMNDAYDEYMRQAGLEQPPARTTVGVPLSWPELRVQMDAMAVSD